MALLVEYKCEQTIPKHITIQHKIYQAHKDESNISMQDINTSERQRAITNTGDLFQGLSTLALRPRLQHYEGFSLSHRITQRRNTYNGFTLELLRLTSPSLVPARTTHASTLACRGRTSTPSSHQNSKQREPASPPPQIQDRTLGDLNTLIT